MPPHKKVDNLLPTPCLFPQEQIHEQTCPVISQLTSDSAFTYKRFAPKWYKLRQLPR